jgi:mono/diheme cytochrome c family protein
MKNLHFARKSHSLLAFGVLAVLFIALLVSFAPINSVQALPEYANRTDEACATCHVSPGGAGPLTLGGLAWIADGRPNEVVAFEGVLIAPGVADASELYEIACAACHGFDGEGLSSSSLLGYGFNPTFMRRIILMGQAEYGMPDFEGQFTEEQLHALAFFVSDLSAGRIKTQESYRIPLGEIRCGILSIDASCGGN